VQVLVCFLKRQCVLSGRPPEPYKTPKKNKYGSNLRAHTAVIDIIRRAAVNQSWAVASQGPFVLAADGFSRRVVDKDVNHMTRLASLLRKAHRVTFLTGAGMSTESGLPDFRSNTGLWRQTDPMYLLSRLAFEDRPHEFYAFFRENFLAWADAQPHCGHKAIARLEQLGRDVAVVTQNIDGLHQKAGSSVVLELHGHLRSIICTRCRREYPLATIADESLPLCRQCKAILEPAVVLFGDPLPSDLFEQAVERMQETDVLVVVGTSLTVSPVNTLVDFLSSEASLVIINHTPTMADARAALVLRDSAGHVLSATVSQLADLMGRGYANDDESDNMF
jgi:NAD-dependent deacetylase